MTLLELIGVVTIVAALAVVTLAFSIGHLDQIASNKEVATLSTLGNALERYIQRTRRIPDVAGWAASVATEAGMDTAAVTHNLRNCPRVFLVDGGGWLAANLPYVQTFQTATNITTPPANARIMLVSTIAGSLPVSSGIASAGDFAELWNCADATIPASWAGSVRPDDVKVHRINLTPQFVRLVLSTYISQTNGLYAIDGSPSNAPYATAWHSSGVSGYYLRGTELKLYTNAPAYTLVHTHILNQDTSFVFENGIWKRTITGPGAVGVGGSMGIVAAFLAARPNIHAEHYNMTHPNTQQVLIVESFISYMSNYSLWSSNGFPHPQTYPQWEYLQEQVHSNVLARIQGLYLKAPGYYPTNPVIYPPLN